LITSIGSLWGHGLPEQPLDQPLLDAWLLVGEGQIKGVGTWVEGAQPVVLSAVPELDAQWTDWRQAMVDHQLQRTDLGGRSVMPSFCDPHTHLVWAGDRSSELVARLGGATYAQIAEAGGGILSTVAKVRSLPEEDLCIRAARALQQASGCKEGVHIGVTKSVPAQAGMGGGSSDAASTLLALNRLWNCHLPLEVLARIGLSLGADVPFFLGGHHAWVEGIGEELTPIALAKADFLIVKPDAGLDTRMIFSDPALKRDSEPATIAGFDANALGISRSSPGYGRNDLQAVAQKLCPGVTQALAWLDTQGLCGRMTGSGSAVFAHLPQGAVWDAATVPKAFKARQCSSLDVHPLLGWADSDS
jgi:4-diphosphocytidyl-2-C-methyl-D-erythritol kinase